MTNERPTHGCMEHLSRVVEGERWPQIRYRVFGARDARPGIFVWMLKSDGTWWPRPDDHPVFVVPADCTLSQEQMAHAVGIAGITNALPFLEWDMQTASVPIVYGDARAPGKPWV